MNQRQNQHYHPDDAAMDQLGNKLTGGSWSIFKTIFYVLVEANSNLIATLLRKKQGTFMFSFGKIFWISAWMFIVMLICQENWRQLVLNGQTDGHRFSWNLLWWHGTIVMWLFIIKWIIASFSIGSKNPRWFRYRDSVGESILWPIIAWLLRPLKVICDEGRPRFWQLSKRRWMLTIEPLILVLVSNRLYDAGYTAYGNFLFWATLAFAYTTFRAVKNTDMEDQVTSEAENMA